MNGARVLICLAAYGDPRVEAYFGFRRRAWRSQRVKTRQALLDRDRLLDASVNRVVDYTHIPPTPETLYAPRDQERVPLLSWDAHERIRSDRDDGGRFTVGTESPFNVEDYVDPQGRASNDKMSAEKLSVVHQECSGNVEQSALVVDAGLRIVEGDQNV